MLITRTWMPAVGLVLAGCVSLPPGQGSQAVSRLLQDRVTDVPADEPASDSARTELEERLSRPLSERGAVQIALALNPTLRASYASLGIAQGMLLEAMLLPNPLLDAGLFFPLSGGSARLDLGLRQNLLAFLMRPTKEKAAHAELEAEQYRVADQVVQLVMETRVAFLRLQADQKLQRLMQDITHAADAGAEAADALYESGNRPLLDRDASRLVSSEARLARLQVETRIVMDRERLLRLLGVQTRSHLMTAEGLEQIPSDSSLPAGVEQNALEVNLQLDGMRKRMEASAARLRISRARGLIPALEAGLGSERDGDWDLGPAVSVPVPLFNHGQGTRMSAVAELQALRQNYLAKANEVRSASRQLSVRLVNARAVVDEMTKRLLPLRRSVLRQTQYEYNTGKRSVFELLRMQQSYIQSARGQVDALADYWIARARMDALLGGYASPPVDPVATEMAPEELSP